MSRRSTRNRNVAVMDKREIERMIESVIARRYTPPAGANVTPITQAVINQMQAQMAPQDKTQGMFSPGAPIQPTPGITPAQGPRQFQYPFGYNIGQHPRSTELTSFDTLRNLAALYDGIGLCERVWFDLCSKPELQIKPKPKLTIDEKGDPIPQEKIMSQYGDRIAKWEEFFAKPDKRRSLKSWMRMALKEVLEIDALSIYKHKDRSGGLYALEILDGSTIKPLLDERGMAPYPPYPAYQQFVYGVPGMLLLGTDLIYRRETERVESPYGLSRVERIILRVNQALRKQNKDLATFTDGNMPAGTLEPPDDGTTDWTPEQLFMYQEMWDGMLAGNDATKSRIKVIPPGSKFNKFDPDDIMFMFDQFLLNVTVGDFGLTMAELSFTESVNKSSGETQEAIIYRRAMSPIMDTFGETFTDVMVDEGETDLYATWKAFEEPEDFKTKVEAWNILTTNGTQSTSQAATALGLKPLIETEPFIIVPGQGIQFISDVNDMREEAKAAKLAGYDQQQHPEAYNNEQGTQQGNQGTQGAMAGKQGQSGGATKTTGKSTGQSQGNGRANGTSNATRNTDGVVPGQSRDAERAADYRRWRERALKDVKEGKLIRLSFSTNNVSENEQQRIRDGLELCKTADDVKRVFADVKRDSDAGVDPADTQSWQEVEPEIQDALKRATDAGYTHGTWKESLIPCAACLMNRGAKVRLGETFPSGAYYTPNHNHCGCEIILSMEDEA